MNGKDYYKILGVARNASDKEIKSAYRKLARKHHPDVNPGDKGAETRFREVQEAYEVLGNAQKRAQFDQFGQAGPFGQYASGPRGQTTYNWSSGGGGTRFDFGGLGDLFETFVGRTRTSGRPGTTRRKQDVSYPVELTIREAYKGTARSVNLKVDETCPTCKGRGAAPDGLRTCGSCGGNGKSSGRSGFFDLSGVCEECGGAGEIVTKPCNNCRGAGSVAKPRRLDVKIPAGVTEGQKIRVAGQGPGGGDVFLVAHIKADAVFSRKGDDVWVETSVSYPQAALGAEIEVPTLDGGNVKVTVPPETSSGQALRLSGLGFPSLKGKGRGNQYVRLRIVVPKQLSDEEKELIRKLASARTDKSEATKNPSA